MPQVYLPKKTIDQFHQDALGQETDLNVEARNNPPEPPPPPEPTPEQLEAMRLANNPPPAPPPPAPMPPPPDFTQRGNPVQMPTALPNGSSPLDLPVASPAPPVSSDSLTNPLGTGNGVPAPAAPTSTSTAPGQDSQSLYQDLLQRSGIAEAAGAVGGAVGGAASALGTTAQGAAQSAQERLNQVQAAAGLDLTPPPAAPAAAPAAATTAAPSLPHNEEPGTATDQQLGSKWKTSFDFGSTYTGDYRTGTPHRGVDLVPSAGGGIGTEVDAFAPGTVSLIQRDSGAGGLMVYVQDASGLTHAYMHLAGTAPGLAVGQQVARGQAIAQMGESGTEGSPHLHYEVRKNASNGDPLDKLIDPRPYITGAGASLVDQAKGAAGNVISNVQTTAGLSGGGQLAGKIGQTGQDIMGQGAAAASWLGDQGQRALQAILVTEGGLAGARGDGGKSAGPLQFYEGGQLANFAKQAGLTLEAAKQWVEENPVAAVKWAIGTADAPGYLGAVLKKGQELGLKGADLATYAQRFGQVSVSPERAGQNFDSLFGGGGGLVYGSSQPSPSSSVPGVVAAPDRATTASTTWVDPRTKIEKEEADLRTAREQKMTAAAAATEADFQTAQDRNRQQLAQIQAPAAEDPNPITRYSKQLADGFAGMLSHIAAQVTSPATTPQITPASSFQPPTPSDSLTNPTVQPERDPNAPLPSASLVQQRIPIPGTAEAVAGHYATEQGARLGEWADVKPRNAEQEEFLAGGFKGIGPSRQASLGPIPVHPRIAAAKEIWWDNHWGPGIWGARQGAGEEILAQQSPEYAAMKDEEQSIRDKLRGNLELLPEAERETARADQVIPAADVARLQELHRRMTEFTSGTDLQELAKQHPDLEQYEEEASAGQSTLAAVTAPFGLTRGVGGALLAGASMAMDPQGAPLQLIGGGEKAAEPLAKDLFRWGETTGRDVTEAVRNAPARYGPAADLSAHPGQLPTPPVDDIFSRPLSRNERVGIPGTGITVNAPPPAGEVIRGAGQALTDTAGRLFGDVTSSPEELARITAGFDREDVARRAGEVVEGAANVRRPAQVGANAAVGGAGTYEATDENDPNRGLKAGAGTLVAGVLGPRGNNALRDYVRAAGRTRVGQDLRALSSAEGEAAQASVAAREAINNVAADRNFAAGATRLGTDTRPGLAEAGELTRIDPENVPNKVIWENTPGARMGGDGGFIPPPHNAAELVEGTENLPWDEQVRKVIAALVPNTRIPRDLHDARAEAMTKAIAGNGQAAADGRWAPEATAIGAFVTKGSIGRAQSVFTRLFDKASGIGERVFGERPTFQTQTGPAKAGARGLVIRPELVFAHAAGDTTDPQMMAMLTALSRPSLEELRATNPAATIADASFATRAERDKVIKDGVDELYKRALVGGHGSVTDKELINGTPITRSVKNDLGEKVPKEMGMGKGNKRRLPWADTMPRLHEIVTSWAQGTGEFAGLSANEKRAKLLDALDKSRHAGMKDDKLPFFSNMTFNPDYGVLDLRMRRDVFGLDPKAKLSEAERSLLEKKLADAWPAGNNYVSQWKPWEYLSDEKTDYSSLPGVYTRVNDMAQRAAAQARAEGRPVGEVIQELAAANHPAELTYPVDPHEVVTRIGVSPLRMKEMPAGIEGPDLEKQIPELRKFAEQAGVKVEGKPRSAVGGWLDSDSGTFYKEGALDHEVSGPLPAVRFYAASWLAANPEELSVMLVHRGPAMEHTGSVATIDLGRLTQEEAIALHDAFTQTNPDGWTAKMARSRKTTLDGRSDTHLIIAAPDMLHTDFAPEVSRRMEAMHAAGVPAQRALVEPATVEFMDQAAAPEVIYRGPRGAQTEAERAAESANLGRGEGAGASAGQAADEGLDTTGVRGPPGPGGEPIELAGPAAAPAAPEPKAGRRAPPRLASFAPNAAVGGAGTYEASDENDPYRGLKAGGAGLVAGILGPRSTGELGEFVRNAGRRAPRLPERWYTGTGRTFDKADAAKFDPHGLVGPGDYMTSDPRVAGGAVARGGELEVEAARNVNYYRDMAAIERKGSSPGNVKRAAEYEAMAAREEQKATRYKPGEVISEGYAQKRMRGNLSAEQLNALYDATSDLVKRLKPDMTDRQKYAAMQDVNDSVTKGNRWGDDAWERAQKAFEKIGATPEEAKALVQQSIGDRPAGNVRVLETPPRTNAPRPRREPTTIDTPGQPFAATEEAQRLNRARSDANDKLFYAPTGASEEERNALYDAAEQADEAYRAANEAHQAARGASTVADLEDPTDELHLLHWDEPLGEHAAEIRARVTNAMDDHFSQPRGTNDARLGGWGGDITEDTTGEQLREMIENEYMAMTGEPPEQYQQKVQDILHEAGFDGIVYQGGRRIPMVDETGRDIHHDAVAIFGQALPKVKNVLSGKQGGQANIGLALNAATAAGGGAAGWNAPIDEDAPGWERPARAVAGTVFGGTLPAHVMRSRPGGFGYGALRAATKAARQGEIATAAAARATAGPASKTDKLVTYTTANMLSGIGTAMQNTLGGVSQTLGRPAAALFGGRPVDAARDVLMMGHSMGEALRAYGETARTGVGATNPHEVANIPGGPIGTALSIPLRNLSATDEFFRVLNANGGAAAAASKKLRDNPGMDMATMMANHGPELLEAGRKAGREAVYAEGGGPIGDVGAWLSKSRGELMRSDKIGERGLGYLMQWLMPMTGVPSTILGKGSRMLPGINEAIGAGQLAHAVIKRDPEAGFQAIKKTGLGFAVNYAILGEVLQGNITGDGPTNPQEKARLMEAVDDQGNAVWRPNSIRVNGRWFDYSGLGHVALPMAMIANGVQEVEDWSRKPADKRGEWPELGWNIGSATARTVSNAWYLRNLGDVLDAMKTGNAEKIGSSFMTMGDRLVPLAGAANEARKVLDQTARDPQNPLEHFENRIPGLSQKVPPRYTATTGKPMEAPQDVGSILFRGTPPAMMSPNPLAKEVARLNAAGESVSVPLQDDDYAGTKQSRDQTSLLRQTMGQAANLYALNVLTDPKYENATDAQKADAINKAVTQSRSVADIKLGADVARDPHHQALREWAQTPQYLGVKGTPDEIQQANFAIAQAKSKLSEYTQQYGAKARHQLKEDDPAAFKLSNRQGVDSARLKRLKKTLDDKYGGALLQSGDKAAAAGLVGVGSTIVDYPQ